MTIIVPLVFALAMLAIVIGVGIKLLLIAARVVDWDRGGPVTLGVCHRMARRLDVPVRGVRMLTAAAIVFTGVVPGFVAYVVAAAILGRGTRGTAAARPKPHLLGLCADLARRLDVPVDNVRFVAMVATLATGVVPGMLLYCVAGMVKALVVPGSRLEAWIARDLAAWPSRSPVDARVAEGAIPGRIGRYRILGLLGRGGMGSVWRGRDDALGRDAAVKVVEGPFGGEAVRRFGEEARAAAALASPHIVQVWEYAPEARPPFLAMEYVPGRSVAQLIRAGGPQPVATVLDCARQVLSGLASAHAAGIVHRDIKPANILLATSGPAAGTYKLTDFGLATSPERDRSFTATGTLLGTLSYLAPEVAIGDDATAASDLYAVGATLHEMLVGRPPLSAESPLKLLRRITTETVPPVAALRPDLPPDVAAWLDRLLSRDPADRFQSAERALAALAAVAGATATTTDVGAARATHGDDAIPWHLRPMPGAPLPRRTISDVELPDVVGRAMAFEADGRDALGEDSILDIARELNVDTRAVREALLERRRGGEGGVTQIFRRALGGHERIVVGDEDRRGSPVAPAVADDDHVRPGGLAVVTAIVAGGLALVAITLVFVLATARQVVTEGSDDDGDRFGEAIQLAPQGIDVIERSMPSPAEAPPSPQHESPPSSAPGKAATRPAVPAGSGNRSPSAAGRVSLTEWAVISLVGAAVAALSGLGRRRRRWFV